MLPASKLFDTHLSQDVWKTKYSNNGADRTIGQTMTRVAKAVMGTDSKKTWDSYALKMLEGVLMPAGRITAGAGTGNRVTLMNCYVMGTINDSLDDIFKELNRSALTMQQGGGIGTDFSTLRPHGALLKRTGSFSSGPLSFMDTWDAMCRTIMSAGHRRGAMMGTLRISHPDVLEFIKAKQTKGRMTNFNISLLVTTDFMDALREDDIWRFTFPIPKKEWGPADIEARSYFEDGKLTYVYDSMSARALWNIITRSTYEYSEPGVIFIDRINETNNLNYLENISCTNPCGEQPLPPYGACDLGHINLAMLVRNPFTPNAKVVREQLQEAARMMTRFLNNVIDVTEYPLEEQRKEQLHKRRIGVGITGLADALNALGLRYGSKEAVGWTQDAMHIIAEACYTESVELAKVHGPFPGWDAERFNYGMARRIHSDLADEVRKHGLRNGVLLTVAPTGTMSSFYGNVSGGCEPTFSHRLLRKVRQADDTFKEYFEYSLTVRSYAHTHKVSFETAWADITDDHVKFPSVKDLTVEDHLAMQSACQTFVDASISKTINIPTEMPYEKFARVYEQAYDMGCKGCTTYRPSATRGSILEDAGAPPTKTETPRKTEEVALTEPASSGATQLLAAVPLPVENVGVTTRPIPRPKVLSGQTHQIKWPHFGAAVYVTINEDEEGRLCEMFISSKNAQIVEWSTTVSVLVSKLLRLGVEPLDIAAELKQITIAQEAAWVDGVLHRSIIAMIGGVLEQYVKGDPLYDPDTVAPLANANPKDGTKWMRHCPQCGSALLIVEQGCETCVSCGHSKCG